MTEKELISLIIRLAKDVEHVIEKWDSPFGIRHNEVMDDLLEADRVVSEFEEAQRAGSN